MQSARTEWIGSGSRSLGVRRLAVSFAAALTVALGISLGLELGEAGQDGIGLGLVSRGTQGIHLLVAQHAVVHASFVDASSCHESKHDRDSEGS